MSFFVCQRVRAENRLVEFLEKCFGSNIADLSRVKLHLIVRVLVRASGEIGNFKRFVPAGVKRSGVRRGRAEKGR